jgi:hypothetical protein
MLQQNDNLNETGRIMKDLLNTGQVLSRYDMKKIVAGSGSTNCVLCHGSPSEPAEFFEIEFQGQDPNLLCRTLGPYSNGTWGTC